MLDAKQIAEIVRRQDHDPEVGPSTLHYYVQVGILPPAVGRGRSGYTPEHLTRFRLARRLRRQGAALAHIRERLSRMSPTEVADTLAAAEPEPPALYAAPRAAPVQVREATVARLDVAATRYSIATDADPTAQPRRRVGGRRLQAGEGLPRIALLIGSSGPLIAA